MKAFLNRFFLIGFIFSFTYQLFTQSTPNYINYQAIAKDANGELLNQQSITVKIRLISGSISGANNYEEEHSVTTSAEGLITLHIGGGTPTSNGLLSQFSDISWDTDSYYLNIQINSGNGFEDLGTQQLVTVPYAFQAKKSDYVLHPGTSISAGNNITISGSGESTNPYVINGSVALSTLGDNLNGTFDYANEAGMLTTIDYKSYINSGNNISVSGNGLISNPFIINNTFTEVDSDTTNEIELPQIANVGDVLIYDGSNWIAKKNHDISHSTINNALSNSVVTVGNLEIRFNGTNNNGFLECKTLNSSINVMTFVTKSSGSWEITGNTSTLNYRNSSNYNSSNWTPIISLWDGAGWNDNVIISTYESLDIYIYDMGGSGNPVTPNFIYKIKASIDGYNNVFIYAEVSN